MFIHPRIARRWPLFVTEHDPQPHSDGDIWSNRISRWVNRRTAHRYFVHGANCKAMLTETGVAAERILVHPMGRIDLCPETGLQVEREPLHVLFFGSLRSNKGFELLPTIARAVKSRVPEARLTIAGNPRHGMLSGGQAARWYARQRQVFAELEALGTVEIEARFIRDEEVPGFFRRAAIVILPYLDATQSAVAAVAGAFGCATVATRVGDLSEAIVDGETGLLTEAGDTVGFSEAVCRLLEDSALAASYGKAAAELYAGPFSWTAIGQKLAAAYKEHASHATAN